MALLRGPTRALLAAHAIKLVSALGLLRCEHSDDERSKLVARAVARVETSRAEQLLFREEMDAHSYK